MPETILLRGARQLLTLRGPAGPRRGSALKELSVIRDGAILIRDGVILEVGPGSRVESLAAARKAKEWDATGRVVIPGFCDSYAHLCGPWFSQPLNALSSKRLETQSRAAAAACLRHGTTAIEAKTGLARNEEGELKMLR